MYFGSSGLGLGLTTIGLEGAVVDGLVVDGVVVVDGLTVVGGTIIDGLVGLYRGSSGLTLEPDVDGTDGRGIVVVGIVGLTEIASASETPCQSSPKITTNLDGP